MKHCECDPSSIVPPFCLSLGERALLVQEICDGFPPLRVDILWCAAPLPAGAVCDWARGSCVRLLACAAMLVGAGADCAPPSELLEGMAFVCCCTRLCALGSRYARVVFFGLMCVSAAVVCDGCCKLMLLLSLRTHRTCPTLTAGGISHVSQFPKFHFGGKAFNRSALRMSSGRILF